MKLLLAVVLFVSLPLVSLVGCTGGTSDEGAEDPGDDFAPVSFTYNEESISNPPAEVTTGDDSADEEPDGQALPLDSENEDIGVSPENEDVASEPENEDTAAVDPPDEEPVNASTILKSQFPEAMSCGEVTTVSVEVLNTGTTTWTGEDGYKLGTVDDEDPFHETTREWLPKDAVIPPTASSEFEFELTAPEEEGVYTSDWRMVQEAVEWFGDMVSHDITVTCPPTPPWEYTDAVEDSIYATAVYVKDNFSQFFDLEDLPDATKRAIAYDMMTTVINDLRAKGEDASRCVANPGNPVSDPFHWCSDALVVGPPGEGVTVDIYLSWSYPATPQTLVTGTESTGTVTDDLIPLP